MKKKLCVIALSVFLFPVFASALQKQKESCVGKTGAALQSCIIEACNFNDLPPTVPHPSLADICSCYSTECVQAKPGCARDPICVAHCEGFGIGQFPNTNLTPEDCKSKVIAEPALLSY